MTADLKKVLLTYTEAKAFVRSHGVRQREIPVEHALSMLMPTMRFGAPAYAYFASPAARAPGRPMRQSPPDRWAMISAHGGRLMLYALTSVHPFTTTAFNAAELPTPAEDVAKLRERITETDALMERAAARWFAGEALEAERKTELAAALGALIPAPLAPQYEALAPDFFAWLTT